MTILQRFVETLAVLLRSVKICSGSPTICEYFSGTPAFPEDFNDSPTNCGDYSDTPAIHGDYGDASAIRGYFNDTPAFHEDFSVFPFAILLMCDYCHNLDFRLTGPP